jgi:hypothetical protein
MNNKIPAKIPKERADPLSARHDMVAAVAKIMSPKSILSVRMYRQSSLINLSTVRIAMNSHPREMARSEPSPRILRQVGRLARLLAQSVNEKSAATGVPNKPATITRNITETMFRSFCRLKGQALINAQTGNVEFQYEDGR